MPFLEQIYVIVWVGLISEGWISQVVQIQPEWEFGRLSPWEYKSDHGLPPDCLFL